MGFFDMTLHNLQLNALNKAVTQMFKNMKAN